MKDNIEKKKKYRISSRNGGRSDKLSAFFPWIVILGAAALIFGIICLDAYIRADHPIKMSFSEKTGILYDKKNRISYAEAPMNFEAVRIEADKIYASDGERNFYRMCLAKQKDEEEPLVADPKMLISTSDGTVYYNKYASELPDPASMTFTTLLVCDANNNALQKITGDEVKTVAECYFGGEDVFFDGYDAVYMLRFRNENESFMSFCIQLYSVEGSYYLFDRVTRRSVAVPSNVKKIFDSELLALFAD